MEDLQLDPIRQVRVAKRWAFAGIAWAIVLLLGLYSLTLDLSIVELAYVIVPGAALAALAIEGVGRWEVRMHRRYAYPHRLGYELAAIHDFDLACQRSAELIGSWLDIDAVVVGWLSEDAQTLGAAGSYGFPDGWLGAAPRISAWRGYLGPDGASVSHKRLSDDDVWFADTLPAGDVAYVPLISRDKVEGLLGLGARRGNPQLGDRRLLAALGTVMGLALDNCRLYEGERAYAQHFQELNRMKSDFLSTVSHELRTPLTSIMMGAEMLLEEEETRDPGSVRGKLVRNIVKGASRLSTLVNDLGAISREDQIRPRLELEPMTLDDSISNAVSIVSPLLAAKRQSLDLQLDPSGDLVRIDRLRFEQVLINLLSNAQRYSPPGGHVIVSTTRNEAGETVVAVTDSGPGVDPEDADRIFEPFYRGDRSGLGLGLAIAKSIAELHNGRIWVEPGDGHGSRFCVALPTVRPTGSRPPDPHAPRPAGQRTGAASRS